MIVCASYQLLVCLQDPARIGLARWLLDVVDAQENDEFPQAGQAEYVAVEPRLRARAEAGVVEQ
ncbi:hypothetical protein PWY87_04355 [Kribbella solani]|nr:hypothetical protein [Kribbella solani]MDX3000891.1 hypothetical protein [Kribbella solani]